MRHFGISLNFVGKFYVWEPLRLTSLIKYVLCASLSVAARYKAWICDLSFAGIVGSNPASSMDVCFLWVLCVVSKRSLRRGDHSSRAVLSSVVCLNTTWSLDNEEGLAYEGLLRQGQNISYAYFSLFLIIINTKYYYITLTVNSFLVIDIEKIKNGTKYFLSESKTVVEGLKLRFLPSLK
jgi:hypothetical protein